VSNEFKPVRLVKDGVVREAQTPDEETHLRFNRGFRTAPKKAPAEKKSAPPAADAK